MFIVPITKNKNNGADDAKLKSTWNKKKYAYHICYKQTNSWANFSLLITSTNKTQNLGSKYTGQQVEMVPKIINVFPYVGLPKNVAQQEYAYNFQYCLSRRK